MTEEDKVTFIKSHPRMSILKLSEALNISYRSARALMEKHKIVRTISRHWTYEEDFFLMENYASMSIELVEKKLNRSKSSIESRANILCVQRRPQSPRKIDSEYDKMLNNGGGVIQIAPGHIVHRMGW